MAECRAGNRSILLACRGGRHRAPQMCIYLMRIFFGNEFLESHRFIRGALGLGGLNVLKCCETAWNCKGIWMETSGSVVQHSETTTFSDCPNHVWNTKHFQAFESRCRRSRRLQEPKNRSRTSGNCWTPFARISYAVVCSFTFLQYFTLKLIWGCFWSLSVSKRSSYICFWATLGFEASAVPVSHNSKSNT